MNKEIKMTLHCSRLCSVSRGNPVLSNARGKALYTQSLVKIGLNPLDDVNKAAMSAIARPIKDCYILSPQTSKCSIEIMENQKALLNNLWSILLNQYSDVSLKWFLVAILSSSILTERTGTDRGLEGGVETVWRWKERVCEGDKVRRKWKAEWKQGLKEG